MNAPVGQPMAGCAVLITADRRSGELGAALSRRGAVPHFAPALSMVPNHDDAQLVADTRAVIANPPDVVVATTGIGFRGWMDAADAVGLATELHEVLSRARIVARGPKARGAVQQVGLQTDWVAESETSAEVAEYLLDEGVDGLGVAIQHHGAGSDGLDQMFRDAGARVQSLVVYRWGPPPDPQALAASVRGTADGDMDAFVFTSAPGAAAWLEVARDEGALDAIRARTLAGSLLAVAVGPITAKPLLDVGIEPLVPDRGRLGSLVRVMIAHYTAQGERALRTVAGDLQVRATTVVLDEQVMPLGRGGVEVMRVLVAANGGVVPRSEVLRALPGASQDPHAADVAIARLRDAMGDRALIKTVVKRGYRLELAPAEV
ncbi:uroporphyrinogen-III synthase [Sanguibacter sp. 25GB23B1]|uniref:uroporphyrinogen-III synthase n=1 Tax=unclassified Sanguibacter TaxID=2645534 RepID=UPI0032B02362